MKDKLLKFKSSYSPVQININQGDANILADWQRLDWESTFINGKSLAEIMGGQGITEHEKLTTDALKKVFTDVILKDYIGDKNEALDVLMSSFHQGGLLHPVSAGMSFVLKDEKFGPSANANDNKKQVHIKTSEKGFVLQEIYTVKKCNPTINADDNFNDMYPDGIGPDDGKDYVFQAQATINVSFQDKAPITTVINNTINYGNEYVKNIADTRSWLNKLVDFFKNLFNANSVENLSIPEEKIGQNFKI